MVIPTTILALIATGLVLGVYASLTYNRLVGLRNRVREAWSGVDVQLKRRHDLVPALVECVKGYREHERALFESVARDRVMASDAQTVRDAGSAENLLTRDLQSLIALAESYPALKADGNFRQLGATLAEIENDLQYARRYYNGTVRDINNSIQSFPSLIVARIFAFRSEEFFEVVAATERDAPEVRL